jgi:hypothetical protein
VNPAAPGLRTSRPAGAPAYYLGRPASRWITTSGGTAARSPAPRRGRLGATGLHIGNKPDLGPAGTHWLVMSWMRRSRKRRSAVVPASWRACR